MNITLKNIKIADFASQETFCFEASVYIDGKRVLIAENDGHGGCNNYMRVAKNETRQAWKIVEDIDKVLAETTPETDGMPNCLEFVIGELLNEHQMVKEAKRILKRVTYMNGEGVVFQLKAKYKPTVENLEKVKLAKWWKADFRILNNLPINEVVKYI